MTNSLTVAVNEAIKAGLSGETTSLKDAKLRRQLEGVLPPEALDRLAGEGLQKIAESLLEGKEAEDKDMQTNSRPTMLSADVSSLPVE